MPDLPSCASFDLPEALWRFARLNGFTGSLQVFREVGVTSEDDPERIDQVLECLGIQSRVAVVPFDEISYLRLPTMLKLKNGQWTIFREKKGDDLLLEDGGPALQISRAILAENYGGHALDFTPSLPEGKSVWARGKALLSAERGALLQVGFATLILQLLALALPELTAVAMNRALPDGAHSLLRVVAFGMLFVGLFQACTGWIRDHVVLFISTRLEVAIERGFLRHVLGLPFSLLQQKTLGEMLQGFAGLGVARELLAERAVGALLDGLMAVIYIVVMAIKLPLQTLFVVLVALCMAGFATVIGHAQAKRQAPEVHAQALERGYLTELIAGIGTVKASGAESRGQQKWLGYFRDELSFNLAKVRLGLWSEIVLGNLPQAMSAGLLVWGGSSALSGGIQVGTLFGFIQLASGFLGSIFGLVNAYLLVVMLQPQLDRTQAFLDMTPEKPQLRTAAPKRALDGPVIMEDVWFRYAPEGPWVLRGYNLRVEAGGTLDLTGPSGSGKSTVLRLLAGLFPADRGTITIAGQSPESSRNRILYLPQSVQLYGGTIVENLRVLSGGASIEEILEAAQRTELHAFISRLPMGYNTLIPHGARTLSGGQRQLIALTGAIASKRGLLLLDEAAANLDRRLASVNQNFLLKNGVQTIIQAVH